MSREVKQWLLYRLFRNILFVASSDALLTQHQHSHLAASKNNALSQRRFAPNIQPVTAVLLGGTTYFALSLPSTKFIL